MEMTSGSSDRVDLIEARLTGAGSPYALSPICDQFGDMLRFTHAPKNLSELVFRASRKGARTLVISGRDDWSYEDVFKKSTIILQRLSLLVQTHSPARIGVLFENGPDWISAFFGILAVGAVPVLLPASDGESWRHCIDLSNCSLIITSASLSQKLSDFGCRDARLVVDSNKASIPDWNGFEESLRGMDVRSIKADTDPAIVAFTSGSTGLPKAAFSSHRAVISGLMNMMLGGAISAALSGYRENVPALRPLPLVLAPLSHISGYSQILLAAMKGGSLAFGVKDAPDELLDFIECKQITSLVGMPWALDHKLLRSARASSQLSSLRTWNVSGMAFSAAFAKEIAKNLPAASFVTSYGLTETNGGIASKLNGHFFDTPYYAGRVVPTVQIKVLNENGDCVPKGSVGEIWLRGLMLMDGYGQSDGSLAGVREGWFATGDLGYLREERDLFVFDRRNNTVQLGNDFITLSAIEHAVLGLPQIREACAVKKGKPGLESAIVVFAVSDGNANIEPDVVKTWVTEQLNCGITIDVVFCQGLPKRPSGKLDRLEVARLLSC